MESGASGRTKIVRETNEKISAIYHKAAVELSEKAEQAKEGSLTQRWRVEMSESCKARVKQLGKELNALVTDAAARASRIPADATIDWLDAVFKDAGTHGVDNAFRSMLARVSDEALRQVVDGNAYLDGKSLSKRIWGLEGRMNGGINAALAQGIAQHKSAVSLAKDLMRYLDGDQCKYYAKRVAQTSINHAYHLAGMEAAKQNPFCEAIHWQLSASHKIYDICDEYARNDEGLGLGNFDKRLLPLPHANCMCSQYQVLTQSLDECANELRAWLDGEQNAKLDNAFGAWKNTNGLDNSTNNGIINVSNPRRTLGNVAV